MKIGETWYSALIAVALVVSLLVTLTALPVAAANSPSLSFEDIRQGLKTERFETLKPLNSSLAEFSFKQLEQHSKLIDRNIYGDRVFSFKKFEQPRAKTFLEEKASRPSLGHWQEKATVFQILEQLSESRANLFGTILAPNLGWGSGIMPGGGGCGG